MSSRSTYYCDLCGQECGDSEDEPEHFTMDGVTLVHTVERYATSHVCYPCFNTLKDALDG